MVEKMNRDLIEKVLKEGKSEDSGFEGAFAEETRQLLGKFVILRARGGEKNNEYDMMAYVLAGVLSLGTNSIDEAITSLGIINDKTKEIFCEADAILNKED